MSFNRIGAISALELQAEQADYPSCFESEL
jgi:hypothetical protein